MFFFYNSDESDESNEEEYEELGSKFVSSGAFGTIFGRLLCGIGFPLGVTISADKLCGGCWMKYLGIINKYSKTRQSVSFRQATSL